MLLCRVALFLSISSRYIPTDVVIKQLEVLNKLLLVNATFFFHYSCVILPSAVLVSAYPAKAIMFILALFSTS